ncbi:hypothetical protein [Nonomuraea typhae]|uniref:Uncharacterized protein n=1 Tax=Nonomuraea typhae TaxID=2603600 RepID=A0ABW7Z9Z5_9ACTN
MPTGYEMPHAPSDLERNVLALVEILREADRVAAELYVTAGRITRLATMLSALPDPSAWTAAAILNQAAATCVATANLLRQAGKLGADWAWQTMWRAH